MANRVGYYSLYALAYATRSAHNYNDFSDTLASSLGCIDGLKGAEMLMPSQLAAKMREMGADLTDGEARSRELEQAKEALEQARAAMERCDEREREVRAILEADPHESTAAAARRIVAAVPDCGPTDRDRREAAAARERLQRLIIAGGETSTGGRSLYDSAGDEIVRLRLALSRAEHEVKFPKAALPLSPGGDAAAKARAAAKISAEDSLIPGDPTSAPWRTAGPSGGLTDGERAALRRRGWIEQGADGRWLPPVEEKNCARAWLESRPADLADLRAAAGVVGDLSAEDAETLRGAGFVETKPGTWTLPEGMTGRQALRWWAAGIRAEKAPAAAHGAPGRVSGGEVAAAGENSVAPSQGAPQGLPKPARVEAGQRWSLDLRDAGGSLETFDVVAATATEAQTIGSGGRVGYKTPAEMLGSLRWWFLGPAPAPQDPKRDGEAEASTDPVAGAIHAARVRDVRERGGAEDAPAMHIEKRANGEYLIGAGEVNDCPARYESDDVIWDCYHHLNGEHVCTYSTPDGERIAKRWPIAPAQDAQRATENWMDATDCAVEAAEPREGAPGSETVFDVNKCVRLTFPRKAESSAVLATVAELLGLPSEEEREPGEQPRERHAEPAPGSPDREQLGRAVHEAWREGGRYSTTWDDVPEEAREVDRRIGERLFAMGVEHARSTAGNTQYLRHGDVTISGPKGMTLGEMWAAIKASPALRVCLDAELRKEREEARALTPEAVQKARCDVQTAVLEDAFNAGVEEGERRRREYGLAAIRSLAELQERETAWSHVTGASNPEDVRRAFLATGRTMIERAHAEGIEEGERRAKVKAAELVKEWKRREGRAMAERLPLESSDVRWQKLLTEEANLARCARETGSAFGFAVEPTDGQPPTGGEPAPDEGGFPVDVPPEVDEHAAEIAALVDERVTKVLEQPPADARPKLAAGQWWRDLGGFVIEMRRLKHPTADCDLAAVDSSGTMVHMRSGEEAPRGWATEPAAPPATADERWQPGAVWEHQGLRRPPYRYEVVRRDPDGRIRLRSEDEPDALPINPARMTEANGWRYIGRPANEANTCDWCEAAPCECVPRDDESAEDQPEPAREARPEEEGCGGPREACAQPGCDECGAPTDAPSARAAAEAALAVVLDHHDVPDERQDAALQDLVTLFRTWGLSPALPPASSAIERAHADGVVEALLALAGRWERASNRLRGLAANPNRDMAARCADDGEARGLMAATRDLLRLLDAPRGPGGGEREPAAPSSPTSDVGGAAAPRGDGGVDRARDALQSEAREFLVSKDPALRAEGRALRRAARLIESMRDARLVLATIGFVDGAIDRVLGTPADTAQDVEPTSSTPGPESQDGSSVDQGDPAKAETIPPSAPPVDCPGAHEMMDVLGSTCSLCGRRSKQPEAPSSPTPHEVGAGPTVARRRPPEPSAMNRLAGRAAESVETPPSDTAATPLARAVDALERAGWPATADDVMAGKISPAEAARRLRHSASDDRTPEEREARRKTAEEIFREIGEGIHAPEARTMAIRFEVSIPGAASSEEAAGLIHDALERAIDPKGQPREAPDVRAFICTKPTFPSCGAVQRARADGKCTCGADLQEIGCIAPAEDPHVGVDIGTGPATFAATVLERQPGGELRPLATFDWDAAEQRAIVDRMARLLRERGSR